MVAVGDELLVGSTVDTNGAWLGSELASMGIPVRKRFVVADRKDEIQDAVSAALDAAEVVVVTGGLGPTRDDLSRDAVAELLGATLRVDPVLLARLEERFRARGFDRLPAPNVSQAQVPEGALVLPNPVGTAPGLLLEARGGVVVLLPGVPREMRSIFTEELAPRLRERLAGRLEPLFHRYIHTTGIPESALSERIEQVLPAELGPLSIAFLPRLTGVDLRLTTRGVAEGEAREWLDRIDAVLAPVVEGFRYHAGSGDLVEAVAAGMGRAGWSMAVAESCTGGLVAKRLTDRAGSSSYFLGGIVVYANDAKVRQLGVDPAVLGTAGAVSEEVARRMAEGVARAFGADVGLSVTGIAGPEGGTAAKPVGTVWYAVHLPGGTVAERQVFTGGREAVRERSAQAVLALLHRRLPEAP